MNDTFLLSFFLISFSPLVNKYTHTEHSTAGERGFLRQEEERAARLLQRTLAATFPCSGPRHWHNPHPKTKGCFRPTEKQTPLLPSSAAMATMTHRAVLGTTARPQAPDSGHVW